MPDVSIYYVAPRYDGRWTVKLEGLISPVSLHDTQDDAEHAALTLAMQTPPSQVKVKLSNGFYEIKWSLDTLAEA